MYWDIKENKRSKEGIPDRLNIGVVVSRPEEEGKGAFSATVDVVVDTPVWSGGLSSPWEKRRPAVFVPGVEVGEWREKSRRFEELSERDWRELVPFEGEWENVFVEERRDGGLTRTVPGAWPGGPHSTHGEEYEGFGMSES